MGDVDNRIVSMIFDNKKFEENIATTTNSLGKLKSGLDFSGAKQGLSDLTSASKGFHLDGISSALDGISGKFTNMGVVAFTVIQNIVNRAVDAGIRIAKSLSLDQVMSGFREYETNMNAIQTVLANTRADGTTLDDVNLALDKLNQYSDQTIYNFGEMAKNIGTFTAAGVDLETSVSAIKGIANLAATSGSNSQQASSAMYQLSQAIASGSVKLMDWNSIVNAGMGGEVFQKALFETGKHMGTIANVPLNQTFAEWTAAGNTFRGSLEDGWLTSEVLTNTLQNFTGDLTEAQLQSMGYTAAQITEIQALGQTGKEAATKVKTLTQLIGTIKESIGSGWSASFRIIFGDFEEAKTLFTDVSQALGGIVGASADSRNALLQGWKDVGGRTILIEGLKNAFKAVGVVLTTVKEAFGEIFPAKTSIDLLKMTDTFRDFTQGLVLSKPQLEKVKEVFKGVFAGLSIGIEILRNVAGLFGRVFGAISDGVGGSNGVLDFLSNLGSAVQTLKTRLVDGDGIAKLFTDIGNALEKFFSGLTLGNVIDRLIGAFQALREAFEQTFESFDVALPEKVSGALARISDRFNPVIIGTRKMGEAFGWFIDKLGGIKSILGDFGGFLKEQLGNIPKEIGNIFANADYSQTIDTINVGLFGALVLAIRKFLNTDFSFGAEGLFSNVSETFETLTGTLESLQLKVKSEALFKIAAALGLLTASIVVLSLIDSSALTKSMTAMAIGFGQLVGAMALLTTVSSGPSSGLSLGLLSTGIILLSGAVLLLSVALKVLSTISWEDLTKGLGAVVILVGTLALAAKSLTANAGGMIAAGVGMIGLAVALNILALAVKSFAELNWAEMSKGLVGVAASLTIVTLAMRAMPDGMVAKGLGMIALAVALNILAYAVKSFSELSPSETAKGLFAMGGALVVVAGALKLMPKNLLTMGAGLLFIGVGLTAMATAMKIMGSMSWSELIKSLVGMGAALAVLALAASVMQGSIGGAIALGVMSVSLGVLALALAKFGDISWADIIKGLVALAATMTVFAVMAAVLTPVTPMLIAFGAALTLVGLGIALFGAGLFLVASAFGIFVSSLVGGAAVILSALSGLIELLPRLIIAFGEGFIALATKILDAAPKMVGALGETLQALLQLVIDNAPKFAEAFLSILTSMLKVIRDAFPEILATGYSLLKEFLRGVLDNIEEVATLAVNVVLKFLETITGRMSDIVAKGASLLAEFLRGIANNISSVASAAISVLTSYLSAIANGASQIVAAGAGIIVQMVQGMGTAAEAVMQAATDVVVSFLRGLGRNIKVLVDAGWDFLINVVNGITESVDANLHVLVQAGKNLAVAVGKGLLKGLADIPGSIASSISNIGSSMVGGLKNVLSINSPSKKMIEISESVIEGLTTGLTHDRPLNEGIVRLGESISSRFSKSILSIPSMIGDVFSFTPTITPVMDLSQVNLAANKISGIFNGGPKFTPNVSYQQASNISREAIQEAAPDVTTDTRPRDVVFTQVINAPTELALSDIYRQTSSQIALAKQELSLI